MAIAGYLVDKSVVARNHVESVGRVLDRLRESALVAMCGVAELEILYSARNGADHRQMCDEIDDTYERLYTEDEDFVRARAVQGELANRGKHRAVSVADLLIAAVAERHRVTVLHYDADFDLIAEVTEQPMEWVVERGALN